MEGLEFNASLGLRAGDRGLLFITVAMQRAHSNTQVGSCAHFACCSHFQRFVLFQLY